ncbi:amidohydrolase family protein [Pseudochrobactrum asaccharolyticum]|uniref:amidohydrolase family protein n=1 Tax=Pseudochrobactrum asaccharolyticum TaxID=354351 RepID=UPI004042DE57
MCTYAQATRNICYGITALSNLLNSIEFEFVGEISFTHRKLLVSFLSHKVSTNLGAIQDAVTRVMNEGGGEVFFPEECISVDAALRAVTIDAAWQCHTENQIGSLETGKFADFVILEEDPTTPDVKISKIKVSETWMDGTKRYAV